MHLEFKAVAIVSSILTTHIHRDLIWIGVHFVEKKNHCKKIFWNGGKKEEMSKEDRRRQYRTMQVNKPLNSSLSGISINHRWKDMTDNL